MLGEQVKTAVRLLKQGGVIAMPTDTLYGLAASASDEKAVKRLFSIKGRPRDKPLPLMLADSEDIARYTVEVPDVAWRLAERFLPGALTLVLRKAGNVSDVVSGGSDTIAVRVPDHSVPRAIVRELGAPITGTSANRAGMPGPTTAAEVRRELGDEVDLILDAGPCQGGVASTVLDLTGAMPSIVRVGAVSRLEIEEACGVQVEIANRRER